VTRRDVFAALEVQGVAAALVALPVFAYTGDVVDVVRVFLAVLGLLVGGGLVWAWLRRDALPVHRLELLGAGGALALALLAGGHVVVGAFADVPHGGPMVVLTTSVLCAVGLSRSHGARVVGNADGVDVFRIFVLLVLGLLPSQWRMWPAIPALVAVGLLLRRRDSARRQDRIAEAQPRTRWMAGPAAIVSYGVLLAALPRGEHGSLFGFGTESIPRIAMGNSVLGWGPGENIALAGKPLRYHWFTHLAQALLRQLVGVDPEVLVFAGSWGSLDIVLTGALLWALAGLVGRSSRVGDLAVAVLCVAIAPTEPFRVFTDSTPDATSWLTWYLLGVVMLICWRSSALRAPWVALPAVAAATILGNGPYGVVFAASAVALVLVEMVPRHATGCRVNRERLRGLTVPSLVVVVSASAYLRWLTPSDYSTQLLEPSLRFVTTIEGGAFVLLLLGLRMLVPLVVVQGLDCDYRVVGLLASLMGVLAFVIYRNSTGMLTPHFAMPALAVSSIAAARVLVDAWESHKWRVPLLLAGCMGLVQQPLFNAVMWRPYERFGSIRAAESLPVIVLGIVGVVIASVTLIRSTSRDAGLRRGLTVGAAVLVVFMLGSGSTYALRGEVREAVDRHLGRNQGADTDALISQDRRDAYAWLRNNTPRDAVLATDLVCGQDWADFFQCPGAAGAARGSLLALAAIGERRVLVEGEAWAHVGLLFTDRERVPRASPRGPNWTVQPTVPVWLKDRIVASRDFGAMKSPESWQKLRALGVTWFVDLRASGETDLEDDRLGEVRYENDEVSVIRLSP
jgi:hypothetical protein